MAQPKIAISDDFFTAFAALPRQKQGRVIDFMTKFRSDPRSPGINYEKIHNAFDPNIRSVRIDDTYRGILARQEENGVYILLWVDHHDKAYQWASRRRCKINPTTGSVQVFEITETPVEREVEVLVAPPLFADVEDDQLLRLGVPEEKIADVRSLTSVQEFYAAKQSLPEEAYEGLEWIANGFGAVEVLDTFYDEADEDVDPNDFDAALSNPRSQKSFVVIDGETELFAIMGAPLDKWRVFLHPTQRKTVVKEFNGPARVTGGAGTGKTVVAMHRAKWLATRLQDNERILFTTFTRNLASDIQENLRKICTHEELRKIEVTNLDSWVARFLRESDFDYDLVYGDQLDSLWEDALVRSGEDLDYPVSFYQEEWSKVIHAHGIDSLKDYAQVSRVGRGIPLDRRRRISVWKVFEEFHNLMIERQLRDIETAMSDCRKIIESGGQAPLYQSIVVDEGQDLSMSAYHLLRAIAGEEHKNDLFIVGDSHQRIYRHKAPLSHCGINIRGRSSYLRINYRTTEEIRKWAFGLLQGIPFDDLDDGLDDGDCISLVHGREPSVRDFNSADQEFEFVLEEIRSMVDSGGALEDICIVARTGRILDNYKARLANEGHRVYEIKRRNVDNRNQPGIRIATMHRVKGLEFEHVFVVSANRRTIPLAQAVENGDPVARDAALVAERCLLYVALTRAKQTAYLTSSGGMSEFVSELMSEK